MRSSCLSESRPSGSPVSAAPMRAQRHINMAPPTSTPRPRRRGSRPGRACPEPAPTGFTRACKRRGGSGRRDTDVTGLTRNSHANWRGQAMRSGILNQVNVDFAGGVDKQVVSERPVRAVRPKFVALQQSQSTRALPPENDCLDRVKPGPGNSSCCPLASLC